MKKFKKIYTLAFLFITQLISAPSVLAATINTAGLETQDKALMANSGLAGNSDLSVIISVLIKSILGFLGVIFLALTIMAGFKWMNSQGNEDEIKKAKDSLKNSIIGLVIVLAAYSITYWVFTYLPFAGNSGGVDHTK
jgi:hypothetical protein